MPANLGLPPASRFKNKGAFLDCVTSAVIGGPALLASNVFGNAPYNWNYLVLNLANLVQAGFDGCGLCPPAFYAPNGFTSVKAPYTGVYSIKVIAQLGTINKDSDGSVIDNARFILVACKNYFTKYINVVDPAKPAYPDGLNGADTLPVRFRNLNKATGLPDPICATELTQFSGNAATLKNSSVGSQTISLSTEIALQQGEDISLAVFVDTTMTTAASNKVQAVLKQASVQIALTDSSVPPDLSLTSGQGFLYNPMNTQYYSTS